tara:strand:- start:1994 stop:2821 length:828 start_codon:yes stop_codon:yes gene_type:complete
VEIEDISIREIPQASIDLSIINTPNPKIPGNIGFPVIQIPGCVRARTLKNKNLVTNDERGNLILCDGNVPTLESMAVDWTGVENIQSVEEEPEIVPPVPKLETPKEQTKTEKRTTTNKTKKDKNTETDSIAKNLELPKVDLKGINTNASIDLPCPLPGSPPPGAVGKFSTKVVLRYEKNGNLCETIYQDRALFDVINSYTPPPSTIVNTSTIAITSVVGVTVIGQPLAKFFQKQLKGQAKSLSKKITKKLLAIRGKKPLVKSLSERRKDQRNLKK